MTSPPTGDWPTEVDDLARIAADSAQPAKQRERAFQELVPEIHRLARRVAARSGQTWTAELLADASGEVWEALASYQPGKPFAGWCYGVLRNHLVDRIRKEQREQVKIAALPVRTDPDMLHLLEMSLDHQEPFDGDDLAQLDGWPLQHRLAVLCICGLWHKVPTVEWGRWLQEYQAERQIVLPSPFPPDKLAECETTQERLGELSLVLGIPRNTMSVWLCRCKQRLRELRYVRNLLRDA